MWLNKSLNWNKIYYHWRNLNIKHKKEIYVTSLTIFSDIQNILC